MVRPILCFMINLHTNSIMITIVAVFNLVVVTKLVTKYLTIIKLWLPPPLTIPYDSATFPTPSPKFPNVPRIFIVIMMYSGSLKAIILQRFSCIILVSASTFSTSFLYMCQIMSSSGTPFGQYHHFLINSKPNHPFSNINIIPSKTHKPLFMTTTFPMVERGFVIQTINPSITPVL